MTLKAPTWTDRLDSRLRSSDQWFKIGDLYEEFRLQMPLQHAVRSTILSQQDRERIPDGDKAQWQYLCSSLRQLRVERQVSDDRRIVKTYWTYNDLVRLPRIEGIVCLKCGNPVVKVRHAKTKIECLQCRNPPPASEPIPEPPPFLEPDVLRPVIERVEIIPTLPPVDSVRLKVIDRRGTARWLKSILPFGDVSVNMLEKQLLQSRDSVEEVLCRYGVTHTTHLINITNRRKFINAIRRHNPK